MKNKYHMTAFTRLLLFIILFAPVAYIGGAYINGENGLVKIKTILRSEQDSKSKINKKKIKIKQYEGKIQLLKEEIKLLENG